MRKRTYDGRKKAGDGLTEAVLITRRLVEAFDPIYRNSLYEQMRYAFGETWRKDKAVSSMALGDAFPDYPDIIVRYQEIGRSRRILNSQFIGLSRVMYADPQPEFPQVDKYTAEVRKQFFLARYRGDSGCGEGEWQDDMAAAFMDGDGLGIGFAQICLRTNPKTGLQQVHLRHSPAIFTLWDRFERSPARARWICFVRYLPMEDAVMVFGKKTAEENVRVVYDGHTTYGVQCVRYFEYYDLGVGNGKPSRAIILGELRNAPWKIEENVFGCLPFSFYCHVHVPGMRRPIGRITIQMNTQEAINEIERSMRKALRAPQFSIADVTQLDEEDLKAVNAGDANRIVRWKAKPGHTQEPFVRTPGAEVSETVLKLFDLMDKQFTVDSGVTDFDRGVQPQASRTLGEDMLVDQRGQTQTSWSELQAVRFHVRTVRKALEIAGQFDRDPVTIEVFGKNYTVNSKDRPASTISNWLRDPSQIVINTDSLRYQDVQQVRIQRLQQLLQVAPFVGQAIDLHWFAEELAKALGEQDPKQAIAKNLDQQPGEAPGQSATQAAAPQVQSSLAQMPTLTPSATAMPGMGQPPALMNPAFRTQGRG